MLLSWADSRACCAQTAEVQKTLESLKDALTTLEKGKAPAEGPRDSITLTDLRSELRVLASSLNECVPAACACLGIWLLAGHTLVLPCLRTFRGPCCHPPWTCAS